MSRCSSLCRGVRRGCPYVTLPCSRPYLSPVRSARYLLRVASWHVTPLASRLIPFLALSLFRRFAPYKSSHPDQSVADLTRPRRFHKESIAYSFRRSASKLSRRALIFARGYMGHSKIKNVGGFPTFDAQMKSFAVQMSVEWMT